MNNFAFHGYFDGQINSVIENCINHANIDGYMYVGGICAAGGINTIIEDCINVGVIEGHSDVSGITCCA